MKATALVRRYFPHPLVSVILLVVWLLLTNAFNPGQLVLGTLLAWAIPRATRHFWPEHVAICQPLRLFRFSGLVLYDILIANVAVARLILFRAKRLEPAFFTLPLELKGELPISLLANIISLTPGTVSSRLSADRRSLLIHALHLEPGEDPVADIKARYERPLKEIFESC